MSLFKNTRTLISAILFTIAGAFLIFNYYYMEGISWSKLLWLLTSVLIFSWGLTLLTVTKSRIQNWSRIFTGIVFTYSGIVKAVDPLGSNYKFNDYFSAWGMDFMYPASFYLGLALSTVELVIGLSLLFNLLTKYTSIFSLLFMLLFTPITLYLALQEQTSGKEVVHDCGCFGDALVLSNWQTFTKNLIILIPVLVVYYWRKRYLSLISCVFSIGFVAFFTLATLGLSFYSLKHYLPFFDFRPYTIGTDIKEKMKIPEGEKPDLYMTFFKYKNKKTGEISDFDQNNLPWQDSLTWQYVDGQEPETRLVEKGFEPAIHDFSLSSDEEGDITQDVLADQKINFLLIAYNINDSKIDNQKKINDLYNWCQSKGYGFRCMTSSLSEDVENFKKISGAAYKFYSTDPITLKTIVRSNPGLVMLKSGIIMGKWHHDDIPEPECFEKKYCN